MQSVNAFGSDVKHRPPHCTVDSQSRHIVAVLEGRTVQCEIPTIFGAVFSAEVRGDFIVAHTMNGKVSFYASSSLAGKMPWHAMLKAFRTLCLVEALADRVELFITHYRYKSGGRSRLGAAGRIMVDGQLVSKGVGYPGRGEFSPQTLGAALAEYLHLSPLSALSADEPMVQALALLDRRLSDAEFLALEPPVQPDSLSGAFYRLRASTVAAPELAR